MGNRLKELRKEKGVTQAKVAEIVNTNQSQYGKYENGKTNLSLENSKRLASYFGVSVPYLLGLEETIPIETNENSVVLSLDDTVYNRSEQLGKLGLELLQSYFEEMCQLRLAYDYLLEENEQLKLKFAQVDQVKHSRRRGRFRV